MSFEGAPQGVVVSLLCKEEEPQRFCRRLATVVNNGAMHLVRAVATGSQVYPVGMNTAPGSATLLRCEFRLRHAVRPIRDADVRDLLDRIRELQVLDAHLVDEHGVNIGPAAEVAVAS